MTTAEKYKQFENSPAIKAIRYIFEKKINGGNDVLENYIKEIKTGKTPSKSEKIYYEDNYIEWYKPIEIGQSIYLNGSGDYLSKYAYDKKKVTLYKPNTLLINCIGDIGRVSILKKEATSNQQITGVLLNDNVLPEYAYLYLVAFRELFYRNILNTTLSIVNQSKIKKIPFKYVPKQDQKSIVEFFHKLNAIEEIDEINSIDYDSDVIRYAKKVFAINDFNKKAKVEITKQRTYIQKLRQQILQEAIQGKLTEEWRRQHPGVEPASELLKRIKAEKEKLVKEGKIKKQKPLPPIKEEEKPFELPEGWVWCRLGEVGIITGGGTPSKHNEKFWQGEILWVSPKDMKDEIIKSTQDTITKEGLENSSAKLIPKNSIIMVGRSGILKRKFPVALNEKECTVNQDMKVLIPHLNDSPNYLRYMLLGLEDTILKHFVKYGMTVHSLKYKEFNEMPIPLPPMKEQIQLVNKLDVILENIDSLGIQTEKNGRYADKLMQAVLREAFEG